MHPLPSPIDRLGPTRRPAGPPQGFHQWRQLLFVHWELDPALLHATLPAGLRLDTHEGRAYVGLVLFTMRGIRPTRFLPPLPGVSAFHETNVRTYVLGPDGRPGVWFYSLDAANSLAVRAARWGWHLPYFRADMQLEQQGDRLRYASTRRWPPPAPAHAAVQASIGAPVGPIDPEGLTFFLAERYLLYACAPSGALSVGQVHHAPYPLHHATLDALDEDLLAAAGLARPAEPLPALYSPGVDVEVFPLQPA